MQFNPYTISYNKIICKKAHPTNDLQYNLNLANTKANRMVSPQFLNVKVDSSTLKAINYVEIPRLEERGESGKQRYRGTW